MPKVFTQYIKNVAKSTGYAINDIAHSMAPNFFEMKDDAKSVADDLYRQIKEFGGPSGEKSAISKAKDTVNDVFKNMLEDISTGKFYNKERSEALMTDVAKSMGMDFDFDMDFGDDWGAGEDFDENDTSDENIIKADRRNTRDTIVAIDTVGARLSNEIGQATAASAKMVATANLNATRALYSLNQRGFNQVTEGIIAVNNSVTNLGAFMAPLSEHFQNSTKFFAETTKTLYNINENLTAILKNTTPSPEATANRHRQSKNTLASLMSGDAFSFSSYKDMVKGNITEALSMYSMIGEFLGPMLKSGKGGKNFSPMSMLFTAGIKHLIPTAFETAVKTLDQNLGHYIAGAMAKAASKNEKNYGLSGILASILLPKREYQETLSTKDYIKGKVAWDGKSRKALIEVIPTYLSKILATIQGSDNEYRYDYDSGKFVEYRDIKRAKEKDMLDRARSAFGVMYSDAASTIGSRNKKNAHMHDQLDKFIVESFRRGADYWDIMKDIYDIKAGDSAEIKKHNEKARKLRKNLGLTGKDEDVDLLLSILRDNLVETDRKGNKRIKSSYANVIGGVEIARNKMANSMKEMGMSGDSIYTNLYNNSYALGRNHGSKMSMVKGATDFGKLNAMYNEKVLNYLEGIYRFTGLFADNIDLLISGGGYKKNGKKKKAKRDKLTENINFNNPIKEDKDDDDEDESLKGLSPEELRARGNAEILSRRNNVLNQTVGTLSERYFGSNWKGAPRAGIQLLRAPFDAATNFLNEITNSFNSFLWGDPKGSEKGVFSRMIEKIDSGLDKLFEEGIGNTIKNGFKNFRDYLFGKENTPGFLNGFLTNTFNELKNAGRWVGNTAKAALYTPIFKNNNGTAAEGRQVTKSGVVTVSEGEMIIPSEFNPYYHGKTNKAQQIANEKNIEAQYLGRYAKGKGKRKTNSPTANDRKLYRAFYDAQQAAGQTNRQAAFGDIVTLKDSRNNTNRNYIYTDENGFRSFDDIGYGTVLTGNDYSGKRVQYLKTDKGTLISTEGSVVDIAKKKAVEVYNRATNFFDEMTAHLSGMSQLTEAEKAEKQLKRDVNKALVKEMASEAKKNNGAIGAGAAIGAVSSFLTGGLLGPIGGAALGAAIGLVTRSQKVQTILFGTLGEDGERSGGLINKEMSNFLQQHGVSIAKGGVLGGIGGTLLMGSPVAGIILGGAAGFARSSEEFQDKLFGIRIKDEQGNYTGERMDTGMISKQLQEYIKKNSPKAIVGGMLGYLLKPIGSSPVLNLILGSAVGMAASSERFKNFMFGEDDGTGKRTGGFLDTVRRKVVWNIDDIAHNTMNGIKDVLRDGSIFLTDAIRNVTSFISKRLSGMMRSNRLGNWILDRAEGLTRGVTNFAGNILGKVNIAQKKGRLDRGLSVYDRRVKRNMTAEERNKLRPYDTDKDIAKSNDRYAKIDYAISGIKNREELQNWISGITDIENPRRFSRSEQNKAVAKAFSGLDFGGTLNKSDREYIENYIRTGKGDLDWIFSPGDNSTKEERDILETQKQKVAEARQAYVREENKTKYPSKNARSVTKALKDVGIDTKNLSKYELDHIRRILGDENVRFSDKKEKENKEQTYRERMTGILTDISANVGDLLVRLTGGVAKPHLSYTEQTAEAFKNEKNIYTDAQGRKIFTQLGVEQVKSDRQAMKILREREEAKLRKEHEQDAEYMNLTPAERDANALIAQYRRNYRVKTDKRHGIGFGRFGYGEDAVEKSILRHYGINRNINNFNDIMNMDTETAEMQARNDYIDYKRSLSLALSGETGSEYANSRYSKAERKKFKVKDRARKARLRELNRDINALESVLNNTNQSTYNNPKLQELYDQYNALVNEREELEKQGGPTTHAYGFKAILSKGEAIVPGMNKSQMAMSNRMSVGSAFVLESMLNTQMQNIILADKYITHMASIMNSVNGSNKNSFIGFDGRNHNDFGDTNNPNDTITKVSFLGDPMDFVRDPLTHEYKALGSDTSTDRGKKRLDEFLEAIKNMSNSNIALLMLAEDDDDIPLNIPSSGGLGALLALLLKKLKKRKKKKGKDKEKGGGDDNGGAADNSALKSILTSIATSVAAIGTALGLEVTQTEANPNANTEEIPELTPETETEPKVAEDKSTKTYKTTADIAREEINRQYAEKKKKEQEAIDRITSSPNIKTTADIAREETNRQYAEKLAKEKASEQDVSVTTLTSTEAEYQKLSASLTMGDMVGAAKAYSALVAAGLDYATIATKVPSVTNNITSIVREIQATSELAVGAESLSIPGINAGGVLDINGKLNGFTAKGGSFTGSYGNGGYAGSNVTPIGGSNGGGATGGYNGGGPKVVNPKGGSIIKYNPDNPWNITGADTGTYNEISQAELTKIQNSTNIIKGALKSFVFASLILIGLGVYEAIAEQIYKDAKADVEGEIAETEARGFASYFGSLKDFYNYLNNKETNGGKGKKSKGKLAQKWFATHPLGAIICIDKNSEDGFAYPAQILSSAAKRFCTEKKYEKAGYRCNFDKVEIKNNTLYAYKVEAAGTKIKNIAMYVVKSFSFFKSYNVYEYSQNLIDWQKTNREAFDPDSLLTGLFYRVGDYLGDSFAKTDLTLHHSYVYFDYKKKKFEIKTDAAGALSWDDPFFNGIDLSVIPFTAEGLGANGTDLTIDPSKGNNLLTSTVADLELAYGADYVSSGLEGSYEQSVPDAQLYTHKRLKIAKENYVADTTDAQYAGAHGGKTDKVYVEFEDGTHCVMTTEEYNALKKAVDEKGEVSYKVKNNSKEYIKANISDPTIQAYLKTINATGPTGNKSTNNSTNNVKYLGYYSGVHHWDDGYTSTSYNRPNWTSGGASEIGNRPYNVDHPFSSVTNPKIKAMLQHGLNLNNKEWYSQDYRGDGKLHTGTRLGREVNQYCSDCSNFVGRMYKDHFGIDLGSYTVEQYENIRDGKVPGMTMMAHKQESRQEHLNDLQPGDVLFFRTKNARKGKADDVTHVELYAGNGKLMGQDGVGSGEFKDSQGTHGSGPTYRDFSSDMYSEKYFPKGMSNPYETVDTYDRFLGYARYTGGASGFVSQFDPAYSNKKVSGKSFAELGCGPAVASMAAAANGIDLSVDDAVRESRGYQDKYGVKSGYFDNVLAKRGLYTNYTKNPYDIYSKLAGGQSVIMLGSDPHNTSKVTSPYGPGNHYVLAKGLMGDKIVVNDPESNGTRLYDKSILANTRLGIATGSSGGRSFGNFVGGATASKEEVQKQVYAWLTSNGYSPAAAAGIMGNIKQESDFKPDDLTNEGAIAAGLFQWHDYTPYKTDPTDYKAMGRFGGVAKLAAANGRDWTDVETQLQYMNTELGSNEFKQWFDPKNATDKGIKQAGLSRSKGNGLGTFPNAGLDYYNDGITFDQFKALQDPVKAARYFEAAFERAGDTVNMDTRVKTAEEFYKKFADSTYTGNWQNTNYNPTTADPYNNGTSNGVWESLAGLAGFRALMNFYLDGDTSVFGLNTYTGDSTGTSGDDGYNANGIPWIVSKQVTGSTTWVLLSNGESMTLDQYNERYLSSNGNLQTALVNCAKARINTEIYSMGRSGTDDYSSNRGLSIKDSSNPSLVRFSDCSYCMQKIYKDIAGVDIGYNTEDQISKAEKDDGAMFVVYNTKDDTKGAEKVLQPGDLVYFYGNNSHYKGVAHVEMYIGDGQMIGQNASGKHFEGYYTGNDGNLHKGYKKGAGPTKKSFHRSKFLMATRLKGMKNYKIKATLNGDPVVDGSNVEIVYYDRDLDKFVWSNGSKTSTTNLFESPDDVTHRKVDKNGKSQLHVVEDSSKGILWSDGNYIVRDKNYTDKTKKTEKVVVTGYDKATDTWTWNDGSVDRKPNSIQRKEYEERMHLAALSDDSGGSSKLFKSGKIFDMNKLAKKQTSGGSTIATRTISPTVDRTYRNLKKSINTSTPSSGGSSKIVTPTIEKKTIGSIPTHSFKAPKTYSRSISGGASALTGIDVKNLEVLLLKLNETLTAIKSNTSVNPTLAASMTAFAASSTAKINSNTRAIAKKVQAEAQIKRDNEYNTAVANITSQLDSIING